MKHSTTIILLAAVSSLQACEGALDLSSAAGPEGRSNAPDSRPVTGVTERDPMSPSGELEGDRERPLPDPGERALPDAPPPGSVPSGRVSRRISVDQLRRSIPRLFGAQWATSNGESHFDRQASSLGEADFLRSNVHVTEPTAIFAKSMDDMASQVCRQVLRDSPERLLPQGPDAVDENLRHMRLMLHGVWTGDGCEETDASLRELHRSVTDACASGSTGCPEGVDPGWYAVCVAMVTDPEFLAY